MRGPFFRFSVVFLLLPGCGGRSGPPPGAAGEVFRLTSPAFEAEARIPDRYTCAGGNVPPPLVWTAPPDGTRSLALLLERAAADGAPPAPPLLWAVVNVPPDRRGYGVDAEPGAPPPGRELSNSFGSTTYDGPCPPLDRREVYVFRLLALDTLVDVYEEQGVEALRAALAGHVLAEARLPGVYTYPER